MSTRTARAAELVELLRDAGVNATRDPRDAIGLAPCVLLPPPRLVFDLPGAATTTWTLVALTLGPGGTAAFDALDDLVDAVAGVLPIETGDAVSYTLPGTDAGAVPAYLLTYTEGL